MGQWKAPLSLRVRQELRLQLEEAAAKELRTLSNFSELLLEWACKQLKVAGTIDRLSELHAAKPRKKISSANRTRI